MDSADGMTTNRTPIRRPLLTAITPRAIELFAELESARRARRRAVDCTISEHEASAMAMALSPPQPVPARHISGPRLATER
jgi:hypothetical protein